MNQPWNFQEIETIEVVLRHQKVSMLEKWKQGQCGWNVGSSGGVRRNNFGEIDKD